MKQFTFIVDLFLADDISNDDEWLKEMTTNIAESLKYAANTSGLAPDGSDTFTETISVREQFLEEAIVIKL